VRVRRGPATVTGEPTQAARCGVTGPITRAGKAGKTVEARSQETCHRHGLIRFAEGGMSRGFLSLASWPGFFYCLSEMLQPHIVHSRATRHAVPTDSGGPEANRSDAYSEDISKVWSGPSQANLSIGRPDSAVAAVQGLLPCAAGLCSVFGDSQQAGPAALPSMTRILKHIKEVSQ